MIHLDGHIIKSAEAHNVVILVLSILLALANEPEFSIFSEKVYSKLYFSIVLGRQDVSYQLNTGNGINVGLGKYQDDCMNETVENL